MFLDSESLALYQYNDVLFPQNHYYNSDALPIEWMEIFETKETLKKLEQNSQISDLFTQSVDRNQIDMTEEPKSFLNKTILGQEKLKKYFKHHQTFQKDFIKENKLNIKFKMKSDKSQNESEQKVKRPTTALNKSTKFTRFFTSRNRPDFLYESANKGFMTQREQTSGCLSPSQQVFFKITL